MTGLELVIRGRLLQHDIHARGVRHVAFTARRGLGGARLRSLACRALEDRRGGVVRLVVLLKRVHAARGSGLEGQAEVRAIGGWRFGGSEACDEDRGLPASELVPVCRVREWLGEHRSGDDDVDRRRVWSDGPLAASAGEDLSEEVSDLGLNRGNPFVLDDGAAV